MVNLMCEKMPKVAVDEAHAELGFQVFQPYPSPDHPAFDEVKDLHVHDIVCSRQMHSEKHTTACFKYSEKECRMRYPRGLVQVTMMDPATGVIWLERDHCWLNAYNPWLALMIRANHDVQILLTKDHVLAAIFYILKYICKPEETLHSKLTIAAAHRTAFTSVSSANTLNGQRMILQIYNKIESHREVGVPEAISHLLDYPDHYSNMTFQNINTTQLWLYITRLQQSHDSQNIVGDHDHVRSQIIDVQGGFTLLSPFDDYRFRGGVLAQYSLYDYCSLIYKRKLRSGLQFSVDHPQHATHTQFCRQSDDVRPCLTGTLFHLHPNPSDLKLREKYFCILVGLFVPWRGDVPLRRSTDSWEDHFRAQFPFLSLRMRRHIFNLDLLHRSKEESEFDRMQREARQVPFIGYESMLNPDDDDGFGDDDDDNAAISLPLTEAVDDVLALGVETVDFYTHEAVDAGYESGLFDASMPNIIPDSFPFLSKFNIASAYKFLDDDDGVNLSSVSTHYNSFPPVQPSVSISDLRGHSDEASSIVDAFTLNVDQRRAFSLIVHHALHHPSLPEQLLMSVFGEAGTGKTRVIDAIRAWFVSMNRANELLVTATTGTAAVNINGRTVHNATGIGIEMGDVTRTSKVTDKTKNLWEGCRYMIIDEVSMLSCQTMVALNAQLMKIKNRPSSIFGGVNLVFFGDFLQFPAVSSFDLYVDCPRSQYALGHRLWRSLNVCVVLHQQMRQAEDPEYAALLQRVRHRIPSEDNIAKLNERVCAPLPDFWNTSVIVRRHGLRQTINRKRVQKASTLSGVPITYCVAKITNKKGMSIHSAYNVCAGEGNARGDGILCLLPGTPLMITQNVKVSHGT